MSERAAGASFRDLAREREEEDAELLGFRRGIGAGPRSRRPKLDGFTEIIDQWLRDDLGQRAKQHHTAKRVFERLREKRPPKLDLDIYPYLPRATVARTSAASYMCLVSGDAA